MPLTLAEKLITQKAGREVRPGEVVVAPVDVAFAQDGTGPLAVRQIEALGIEALAQPARTVFFCDHAAPSPRKELSNDHMTLRAFGKKTGCAVRDIDAGVCHQVIAESFAAPEMIVVGADSHSCMAGALGAFATGMGSTDVAVAMALGKTWLRVPESIRVEVNGTLGARVTSKDVVLELIGRLGAEGATYMALEFVGDGVDAMSQSSRLTLSNMAVECGAKVGLCVPDGKTRAFLAAHGREEAYRAVAADEGAAYARTVAIDAASLTPRVALPHQVDRVVPASEAAGTRIDQVFLGSCTNGRIEDLELFLSLVRGKKKSPRVRVLVTPASRSVAIEAARRGITEELLSFGASINTPGCGACVGVHGGILGDGERCLATSNRNFKGRMGNPHGEIVLGSPATAAFAAVSGELGDVRSLA
jgi:3-isopropylmalate/(R)-2-methylmalate dehydratase large subunit